MGDPFIPCLLYCIKYNNIFQLVIFRPEKNLLEILKLEIGLHDTVGMAEIFCVRKKDAE